MIQKIILSALLCSYFLMLNPAVADDSSPGKETVKLNVGYTILECRNQQCGGAMARENVEILMKPSGRTNFLSGSYKTEREYGGKKLQAELYLAKMDQKYSLFVSINREESQGIFSMLGGIFFERPEDMNSSYWLGAKIQVGEYTYLPLILIAKSLPEKINLEPYLRAAERSLLRK